MAVFQNAFRRLREYIEHEQVVLHSPGLAIGITDREQLLYVSTYGYRDRGRFDPVMGETLFEIGSISKAFTSIALLQLQEQGMLNINDPVTHYLDWFEVQSAYAPITLRHLMSHTAGIVRGGDETPSAFTEAWNVRHTRAAAPPGELFHYSNTGYKILGLVLESVLDQPITQILQERVLAPLGMFDSTPAITTTIRSRMAVGYDPLFDDRPHRRGGALAPATWLESCSADGSICSTAEDMCRFLRLLLNKGDGLLSLESFHQLTAPAIATDDGLHGEQYALGLMVEKREGHHLLGHSGGMVGYLADALVDLDAGLGIVVLTNCPYSPMVITRFAWECLVSELAGKPLPPAVPPDRYKVENPAPYCGTYQCDGKSFQITSQGEHLYLVWQGDIMRLEPVEEGGFLVPHPAFELYLLHFEGQEVTGEAREPSIHQANYGPDCYIKEGSHPQSEIPHPARWDAYPGHYRSHDPWQTNFRVVLRSGSLIFIHPSGEEEPLSLIEGGLFRLGKDTRSPEFLHFDTIYQGQAMQVSYSGGAYSRTFTP